MFATDNDSEMQVVVRMSFVTVGTWLDSVEVGFGVSLLVGLILYLEQSCNNR